jgi:hypothetical protein
MGAEPLRLCSQEKYGLARKKTASASRGLDAKAVGVSRVAEIPLLNRARWQQFR